MIEFYKHSQMADGHLNKCKECTKKDALENRRKNIGYYIKYDRKRNMSPNRVRARKDYLKTEQGKSVRLKTQRNYRLNHPEKYAAQKRVGNYIRDGKINKSQTCQDCTVTTSDIHAHHEDYRKPLEIVWLCPQCHAKRHGKLTAV